MLEGEVVVDPETEALARVQKEKQKAEAAAAAARAAAARDAGSSGDKPASGASKDTPSIFDEFEGDDLL